MAQPFRKRGNWQNEPNVLFVEGYSDLASYAELVEEVGISIDQVFIKDIGGKGNLEEVVDLLLKPNQLSRMSRVGIIRDSDGDANAAFESCRSVFKKIVKVDVPSSGTWVPGEATPTQKFGIFIAGAGQDELEIESLVWKAWKSDSQNARLLGCVETFIDCAGQTAHLKSIDKVRMGAVLSVKNEDDPRVGPAFKAKQLSFNSPVFDDLKRFFNGLH